MVQIWVCRAKTDEAWKQALREAVVTLAKEAPGLPLRMSYAEMEERFGKEIFGGRQPKRALDGVKEELEREGVRVETGVKVKKEGESLRGIRVQKGQKGHFLRICTFAPVLSTVSILHFAHKQPQFLIYGNIVVFVVFVVQINIFMNKLCNYIYIGVNEPQKPQNPHFLRICTFATVLSPVSILHFATQTTTILDIW